SIKIPISLSLIPGLYEGIYRLLLRSNSQFPDNTARIHGVHIQAIPDKGLMLKEYSMKINCNLCGHF
ncbi:MAG: hypothetical protein D3926_19410, partial [Desulfobacteraceae bacterium]